MRQSFPAHRTAAKIIVGDCRVALRDLPDKSVDCCVTSPPYWQCRDYDLGDSGIGMEEDFAGYYFNLINVFREVRRVLSDTGTLWLNLGDIYTGTGSGSVPDNSRQSRNAGSLDASVRNRGKGLPGLANRSLMQMPARIAMGLQDDGWVLRSEIVWAKPNPMPESIKNRPVSTHEKVFLFTKQSSDYFYDWFSVLRPLSEATVMRLAQRTFDRQTGGPKDDKTGNRSRRKAMENMKRNPPAGALLRNVWDVPTVPYAEAHFATYPPALVEPCVRAGSSERGVCANCRAPYERIVEVPKVPDELRNRGEDTKLSYHTRQTGSGQKLQDWREENPPVTVGWKATCECDAGAVPSVVLDPFGGAGTTGLVALKEGRSAILIEANPEYAEIVRKRIAEDVGELLNNVVMV